MKTKLLATLLALLGICITATLQARIWRINNNGFGADYAQINAADTDPNVLAGDTLHLEGSNTVYNSGALNKKLIIIGPGYFLAENPKVSSNGLAATISDIDIYAAAAGSQLIGVSVRSSFGIRIYASNVSVRRCRIEYRIYVGDGISNIRILQNFFDRSVSAATSSALNYSSFGFPSGLYFNNNIVQGTLTINSNPNFSMSECRNNVFDVTAITGGPSLEFYTASFQNNIITTPTATVKINGITNFSTNPTPAVTHNVSSSAAVHFGTANNNIVITNMPANLFVPAATSNSTDGKYQLQSGTTASGSGSDATDRGAFGGAGQQNRYTLSGLSPLPVIYDISTTGYSSATTGLPVIIKSRIVQ